MVIFGVCLVLYVERNISKRARGMKEIKNSEFAY